MQVSNEKKMTSKEKEIQNVQFRKKTSTRTFHLGAKDPDERDKQKSVVKWNK